MKDSGILGGFGSTQSIVLPSVDGRAGSGSRHVSDKLLAAVLHGLGEEACWKSLVYFISQEGAP